jgi:TrkA domain protein
MVAQLADAQTSPHLRRSVNAYRSDHGGRQWRTAPHRPPSRGRFGLLVDADNTRQLFTYEESDLDVPAQAILLEPDEADQVAEILHNQSVSDRLLALERRMRELIEERGAI